MDRTALAPAQDAARFAAERRGLPTMEPKEHAERRGRSTIKLLQLGSPALARWPSSSARCQLSASDRRISRYFRSGPLIPTIPLPVGCLFGAAAQTELARPGAGGWVKLRVKLP